MKISKLKYHSMNTKITLYKEVSMENRYYIKTIIPFVKLLVETIESLEQTNDYLTKNLNETKSKLGQQIDEYEKLFNDYNDLEKEYNWDVLELENRIQEQKQKINAIYGKEEK